MHFIQNKFTADLFHSGSQIFKNLNFIQIKPEQNDKREKSLMHTRQASMPFEFLYTPSLVQEHHLPEKLSHKPKSTHTKLFPFFFFKKCHIPYFSLKQKNTSTHKLMKNCLSPPLVNEERPE